MRRAPCDTITWSWMNFARHRAKSLKLWKCRSPTQQWKWMDGEITRELCELCGDERRSFDAGVQSTDG